MTTHEQSPHAEPDHDTLRIRRIFDNGGPILLRDEPPDGSPAARLVLFTSTCDNPACTCQEVNLLARPLVLGDGGLVEDETGELEALLDVESGEVSAKVAPEPDSPQAVLLVRLRRLIRGDQLDALRARRWRAKHQNETDEWTQSDWRRIDLTVNVPFFEVFPSRWDLSVALDKWLYWVIDLDGAESDRRRPPPRRTQRALLLRLREKVQALLRRSGGQMTRGDTGSRDLVS